MCHSKFQVSCIYYLIQCSQNHMKQILSLPTENETEAWTSHASMHDYTATNCSEGFGPEPALHRFTWVLKAMCSFIIAVLWFCLFAGYICLANNSC